MRLWTVVGVLAAGCVTPRIGIETLAAEAQRNEVAAARLAAKKLVELQARVEDITFLKEEQAVTTGRGAYTATLRGGRTSSNSRTQSVTVEYPYVLLTTEKQTPVACFLSGDAGADALERGKWAAMVGRFGSFERIGGKLRVVLSGCRVEVVSQ